MQSTALIRTATAALALGALAACSSTPAPTEQMAVTRTTVNRVAAAPAPPAAGYAADPAPASPMPASPATDAARPTHGGHPVFACVLAALGACGVAAFWAVAAVATQHTQAWIALLAALDAALLLRLGGFRRGTARALAAVVLTALAIALAQWAWVGLRFGSELGFDPLTALLRLGPVLAWQLVRLGTSAADLALYLAALLLAAWWGR